jgi:heme-degrading monooxygenase HmoA
VSHAISAGVHSTVTTTKGPIGQPLSVATMAGEAMLPWLSEIEGFEGLLMLSNEENGTTLVLTFWESREVAERHRAARRQFREGMTQAAEVSIADLTEYAVTFAHVGQLRASPT